MSKVKIVNQSLQVINLLVKDGTKNKNIQLLSKGNVIIEKTDTTDQAKRLKDLGVLSILPYIETMTI